MTTNAAPGFAQYPRHRVDIESGTAKVEVEFAGGYVAFYSDRVDRIVIDDKADR